MAQEIVIRRNDYINDGFPQGEANAYKKLDTHSFVAGEPVCVLYTPEHSKIQGTNNTVAALFAIGTGNGKGMYQAFSSLEDMYAVESSLKLHTDLFNSMFEKVPFDASDLTKGYYIKAKLDFIGEKTISMKELGEAGEGGSTASGGNVSIKFSSDVDENQEEYYPINGVITLPSYPRNVSELINDSNYVNKNYVDTSIQNAKDTRVDTIIDTTIPSLEKDIEAAQKDAEDALSKTTTLIGSDTNKSVRTITNEVVAGMLDGADADFDTLIEIANYLESHETDAIAMSNAIEALKKITKTFYNNGTVTEDSIKTYIDDAIKTLEDGDVADALADIAALKNITITAGAGLTGGGNLTANRSINVVSANDGITINADNIQLNAVDNLTSTSTTKPLAASQGKVLQANIDTLGSKKITAGSGLSGDITLNTGGTISVNVDNTSIKITNDILGVSKIDGGTF